MMKRAAAFILAALLLLCGAYAQEEDVADMRPYDHQMLALCTPNHFDVEAAQTLGLAQAGEMTDEYCRLQALYGEMLLDVINDKALLRTHDRLLMQDAMRFVASEQPVSLYQAYFAGGMQLFFLRSNLYIERLTAEQMSLLKAALADPQADRAQARAMVEETFPAVICEYPQEEEPLYVVFEPDGKSALNGALVIGVATSPEYDAQGNYVSAAHESEKALFLQAYAEQLAPVLEEALGVPAAVFVYP